MVISNHNNAIKDEKGHLKFMKLIIDKLYDTRSFLKREESTDSRYGDKLYSYTWVVDCTLKACITQLEAKPRLSG